MKKIAIVTDSNSGMTQAEAETYGVFVVPMPFYMNEETFYEDVNLTQEAFYEKLETGADISTSMPMVGNLTEFWERLLNEYEELVYIPMSSGLSSSCEVAVSLAQDYEGRIEVVNNQRISVTQRQSVLDAVELAKQGKTAAEIREILEKVKFESSIYIMVDTLTYLKKGGRITPAAAALGTLLKLKPVLTIQGEKLDAFAKARTVKQAKSIMIEAMKQDIVKRFGGTQKEDGSIDASTVHLSVAYSKDVEPALQYVEELKQVFAGSEIVAAPLSLSIACHIGPGSLALACSKVVK
ncbi:MAG: DegV family protein [Lachnospiraceae bacterium]